MTTFTIDTDNNITAFAHPQEAEAAASGQSFASQDALRGAYARRNTASVTPGSQYQVVVGGHGSTTRSSIGGSICTADYGQTGQDGYFTNGVWINGAGGPGGQLSNTVGDVTVGGGSGGTGGKTVLPPPDPRYFRERSLAAPLKHGTGLRRRLERLHFQLPARH
jgi:hypothetical protein